MSDRKMFPIMDGGPSVPWEVLVPYEAQAVKNHSQSLQRLAERGGLEPGEAWCVISGMDPVRATAKDWADWTDEWRKFAERINLHYAELDATKKREFILRSVLEDLGRGQLQTPGSFEGYVKARCKFVLCLSPEELLGLDPMRPKLPGEPGAPEFVEDEDGTLRPAGADGYAPKGGAS